ncbi:MAG: hypothetical protein Q4F95_00900 [Oscillospiraceae bacterium]|nr:hypothetical protein [Oscillospiraceae bacterium]
MIETEKFKLKKPERTDALKISAINENTDFIDNQLARSTIMRTAEGTNFAFTDCTGPALTATNNTAAAVTVTLTYGTHTFDPSVVAAGGSKTWDINSTDAVNVSITATDTITVDYYAHNKTYIDAIANIKQDAETGKGLSTNDLTDALKSNYDAAYNFSKDPIDTSIDLLSEASWSNGSIDNLGNIVTSNYGCKVSEPIEVLNEDGTLKYDALTISVTPASAAYIGFYTANHAFISAVKGTVKARQNISVNPPEGARYIRALWYSKMFPDGIHLYTSSKRSYNRILIDERNLSEGYALNKYNTYQATVRFTVNINKNIAVNPGNNTAGDSKTAYTDAAVLFLPVNYSVTGKPVRMVISCHGSGTVIDENFTATSKSWNKFFIDMGYAVLDVNGGVADGRHYGAPWAIQSYIKAYNYAIDNYNLYHECFVLGASMGGLSSLGILNSGRIPVLAWGGFEPVTDLYKQAYCKPWYSGANSNNYGLQRKAIAEYYAFSGTAPTWTATQTPSEAEKEYFKNNLDKVTGYNPILYNTNGFTNDIYSDDEVTSDAAYDKLSKHCRVPVKIWHSDDDPIVSPKYSKKFINAVMRNGGIAQIRTFTTGQHATMTNGELVTLTNIYGNSFTAPAAQVEMLYWLQRWE